MPSAVVPPGTPAPGTPARAGSVGAGSIGTTPPSPRGVQHGRASERASGGSVEPMPPDVPRLDLSQLEHEVTAAVAGFTEPMLRKRAEDDGVKASSITAAQGRQNPRGALIALIVERAKQVAAAGGRTRQATAPENSARPAAREASPRPLPPQTPKSSVGVAHALPEPPQEPAESDGGQAQDLESEASPRRRTVHAELDGLSLARLRARMKASDLPPAKMQSAEDAPDPRAASKLQPTGPQAHTDDSVI
jgi:hypothetical protein